MERIILAIDVNPDQLKAMLGCTKEANTTAVLVQFLNGVLSEDTDSYGEPRDTGLEFKVRTFKELLDSCQN